MFKKLLYIFLVIIAVSALAVGVLVYLFKSGKIEKIFTDKATELIGQSLEDSDNNQLAIFHKLLGFEEKRDYLVLFLNNTEMRPGGGFIGVYGVFEVENAKPSIIEMQGTERLDAGKKHNLEPPAPIKKYLKLERWYFRDSNWSPDFVESSKKVLELYSLEEGKNAEEIDGVLAFTPNLISEILKITGPLEVEGIVFNSDNFVEKLEYEVEYGFKDRGLDFTGRKDIIKSLYNELIKSFKKNVFSKWKEYLDVFTLMAEEKQIVYYDKDPAIMEIARTKKVTGEVLETSNDYLLWVDANLGALKTDVALERELIYKIYKNEQGDYVARASMKYNHIGQFDWRISRYLDYTRVFVPAGSKLLGQSKELSDISSGEELGKAWFGGFFTLEPGENKTYYFEYLLPARITKQIEDGLYTLSVQKQIGLPHAKLTLDLDFDKTVLQASPSEKPENSENSKYKLQMDLLKDEEFKVKF